MTAPSLLTDVLTMREIRMRARRAGEFMRLPLRNRVWSGGSGDFMGRGTGSSLDFQDHRNYVPGDDPRHINWQAYARTGQYSMKLFREEVRPIIDLVLDASASQFFEERKAHRTLELFYFCAESALKSGASLQVFLLQGGQHALLPLDLYQSEKWPQQIPVEAPVYPPTAPALPRVPFRGNSLRLFISDLLWPGNPEPLLQHLVARHGRAAILSPFCAAESQVEWDGNYEFIEAETQHKHPRRVEPGLLRRYREAYTRHFAMWAEGTQRYGVGFSRVSAEGDLQTALQAEALRQGVIEL